MKRFLGILVLGLLLAQFQHQTIKADDGLDEEDLLTAQIFSCWSIPLGLPYDEDLVVKIKLELNQDGTIKKAEILDSDRMNEVGQGFYKVLAESALRAIRLCEPRYGGYFDTVPTKHLWLNLNWREVSQY